MCYLSKVVPQVTVDDFLVQMLLLIQELTDLVAGEGGVREGEGERESETERQRQREERARQRGEGERETETERRSGRARESEQETVREGEIQRMGEREREGGGVVEEERNLGVREGDREWEREAGMKMHYGVNSICSLVCRYD